MKVETGRVVIYTSELLDAEGNCVHATNEGTPDLYLHGHSPVLPAIQQALEGMGAGEHITVVAEPANAFGERDERLARAIPRAHWPTQVPAAPGPFAYQMAQEDGPPLPVQGVIVSVDDESVHIDQNHPLAGVQLTLSLAVLAVRQATSDELKAGVAIEFPYDVLSQRSFEGALGALLEQVAPDCMIPPYPWGHALYDRVVDSLEGLDGDVAELGVGLGGTSLFFAHKMRSRRVYALDTFEGLPEAHVAHDNPYFTTGLYGGNTPLLDRFRGRVEANGLTNVTALPGLFETTVDQLPDTLCLAHLDSDLYQSVLTSLEATYDRLVDGGVLILDDFFHSSQGPPRALAAFCNRRGLSPRLQVVFPYSVFLIKGEPPQPRASRCHDGFCYSFEWLRSEPLLRDAAARSVERSWPGTAAHQHASLLLSVLDSPHDSYSDIYDYWRALAPFWQAAAGGFFHADKIG